MDRDNIDDTDADNDDSVHYNNVHYTENADPSQRSSGCQGVVAAGRSQSRRTAGGMGPCTWTLRIRGYVGTLAVWGWMDELCLGGRAGWIMVDQQLKSILQSWQLGSLQSAVA